MKKVLGLMIIIVLLTGCKKQGNITTGVVKNDHKFVVLKKDTCNNEISEYYDRDGRKIYFNCLKEIYLQVGDEQISLKYHLDNVNQDFDASVNDITSLIKKEDMLKDGGTVIYRDSGADRVSADGFTMVVCSTLDDNHDIYFGSVDMEYQDYCRKS